jgi:MazG family protein
LELVARLRAPDGCPWDREQGLAELRGYLLEEAHELAAALDAGNWVEISRELGDLLFQVAFVARLGEERDALRLEEVLDAAYRKMIERHPHVFGEQALPDAAAVHRAWEQRKAAAKGAGSLLGGVPASLPALLAAYRLGQKAAGVGFDWAGPEEVFEKVEEEVEELRTALAGRPRDTARAAEELGDLLFALASLARHLGVDPEAVLAAANRKFKQRFEALERLVEEEGDRLETAGLGRLEELWQRVKKGS